MNVVLLHGFTEGPHLWDELGTFLQDEGYSVWAPTLLTASENIHPRSVKIADMADLIADELKEKNWDKSIVFGHSMGGYVALELQLRHPQLVSALGMVHSTARNDSDERKELRLRTAQFLREFGSARFVKEFTPGLFTEENREKFKDRIRNLQLESSKIPGENLAIQTLAMRERSDHSSRLSEITIPIFWLIGQYDPFIPWQDAMKQALQCLKADVCFLPNSSHMGFFEERDRTFEHLLAFLNSL